MPEHTQQPPRTVLVTGASTFLGGYLVARLAANPEIERILAVDSRVPRKDLLLSLIHISEPTRPY